MSNKANIKFAKFTANKPPLYKYNRRVTAGPTKQHNKGFRDASSTKAVPIATEPK